MQSALGSSDIHLAVLLFGTLAWLSSPLMERLFGEQGAISAILGGIIGLAGSVLIASPFGVDDPLVAYIGIALLFWGITAYVAFLSFPDKKAVPSPEIERHCAPEKVYGDEKSYDDYESNIRTRLHVKFRVRPSSCRLHTTALAAARAYYGFHFARETIELNPALDIVCTRDSDGKCKASVSVTGAIQRVRSPVTVQIDHAVTVSGAEVTVRTTMSATASASGGSVGASFVAGGSIGLPAAAHTFQEAMGTFIWRCKEPSAK